MRIALAALIVLVASPVSAAAIKGKYPMSCREVATHKRIYAAARAGDREGTAALIQQAIDTGACRKRSEGERVRVEETSFPFACVADFGSTAACQWIEAENIDTRQ